MSPSSSVETEHPATNRGVAGSNPAWDTKPSWRNGIRARLRNVSPHGVVGSSPTDGTNVPVAQWKQSACLRSRMSQVRVLPGMPMDRAKLTSDVNHARLMHASVAECIRLPSSKRQYAGWNPARGTTRSRWPSGKVLLRHGRDGGSNPSRDTRRSAWWT